MANRTRYILEDSGRMFRESVTESEIDLKHEIMLRFAQETTVRTKNLYSSELISPKLIGYVNMAVRGGAVAFTLPIGVMPLRARFKIEPSTKLMVPEFTSDSAPMNLEWRPPSSMRLFLLVSMETSRIACSDQFLVAMDSQGRFYRLPTTNAYENCKLCTGEFERDGITYLDALIKAWKQFELSDWQADLSNRGGSAGMANSKQMFKFKALEPEGFEQVTNDSNWTSLCTKVSFEFITNYITP